MIDFSFCHLFTVLILSLIIIHLLISIIKGAWTCFLGYKLGFGVKWKTGDNVWAVVTGATDGIGLEYAKQLAQIGYNLVIISRSEDRLKNTAIFLKDNYAKCKKVETICVDFALTDIYEGIAENLDKLGEIFVLVNNVGTVYHIPEYFLKIPKEFTERNFNLNMFATTKMIEIILPKMIENKGGVIINMSSGMCEHPIPLYTTPSATKAYLSSLSLTLSIEYESKGIHIQTVVPNIVRTKLAANVNIPLLSVTAKDCVSAAIKTVGIERYTYGHWKHKLLAYLSHLATLVIGKRLLSKIIFFVLLRIYRLKYYQADTRKV